MYIFYILYFIIFIIYIIFFMSLLFILTFFFHLKGSAWGDDHSAGKNVKRCGSRQHLSLAAQRVHRAEHAVAALARHPPRPPRAGGVQLG